MQLVAHGNLHSRDAGSTLVRPTNPSFVNFCQPQAKTISNGEHITRDLYTFAGKGIPSGGKVPGPARHTPSEIDSFRESTFLRRQS